MATTLYLTRNGLLEPLGQSQVLAYLRGLAQDHRIVLITYEKDADRADAAAMARMQAECDGLGITWLPQRFLARPPVLAPLAGMIHMVWLTWAAARRHDVALLHARSYIPAAVTWLVGRLRGVPFLFDMRALWPEELITAGRLKRGGLLHRAMLAVERACLRDAGGVVSLTAAAVAHLRAIYPAELADQRIAVIPTCADLDRFTPPDSRSRGGLLVHGCIGTVLSGWFLTAWLKSWIDTAAARDATARFEIMTRDDATRVRALLDPEGRLGNRLSIASKRPDEVPEAIRSHDLSIMFFTTGLSKIGSSPTRMAEVLGTGMPVVANAGVGDVASIVSDNRVGVLMADDTPEAMARALEDLDLLMQDPDLADRCTRTAHAVFSLEQGTETYRALYRDILRDRG